MGRFQQLRRAFARGHRNLTVDGFCRLQYPAGTERGVFSAFRAFVLPAGWAAAVECMTEPVGAEQVIVSVRRFFVGWQNLSTYGPRLSR